MKEHVQAIENKAETATEKAEDNRNLLMELSQKVDEYEAHFKQSTEEIEHLKQELDELKNRGLRKTLIFKNIPLDKDAEMKWAGTKNVLANVIDRYNIKNFGRASIYKSIERPIKVEIALVTLHY